MGKIRTIRPQFFQDERVGRVSPLARYLLVGALTLADDNGVFRGHPSFVKALVFAYDLDITIEKVEQLLRELQENGFLLKSSYRGEQYYIIRTFSKHQKIDRRFVSEMIPWEIVNEAIQKYESQFSEQMDIIPATVPEEAASTEDEAQAAGSAGVDTARAPSLYTQKEVEECLRHDEVWIDSLCMNLHLDKTWVIAQTDEFLQLLNQLKLDGRAYYDQRDIKQRFTTWIKEKIRSNEKARNDRSNDRESRRRVVAERAARRLAKSEDERIINPPF